MSRAYRVHRIQTIYRAWGILLLAVMVFGCRPAGAQQETIPTIFPTEIPPEHSLEAAQRTAELYLSAWQRGDLDAMYTFTTFASQEATPLDVFRALYETSQNEMSFESLTYATKALLRDETNPRVALLSYDVTFDTRILGQFTDSSRTLRLVIDDRSSEWRVAWSAGDIFPEMSGGGRLRLERIIPSRANIYDRTGEKVLADQLGRIVVVSVIKSKIPQYDACLNTLAQAFGKPAADVETILNAAGPDWLAEVGTIEADIYITSHEKMEQDCRAQFSDRPARRYPLGSLAPHILGSVGYLDPDAVPAALEAGFNQDSILGRSGIELSWDETLRGRPGGRLLIVTPGGDILREVARSASQPGQSVWLTLDVELQQWVIQVLGEAYAAAANTWAKTSKGASVVVMDLHTGEILAMVSWPLYDGNAFLPFPAIGRAIAQEMQQKIADDRRLPLLNRATLGRYPAGSTFKIVDTLAVADSGVYTLDQAWNCSGVWQRPGDITRYDWLPGGHGRVTLPQALTRSCNPYFYEVGYQMFLADPSLLPAYARRLGLGSPTGIRDIPEEAGLIGGPEWMRVNRGETWSMVDAVSMAIGQGYVEVTPLQMVRIFAAVGNGGQLLRPQLVKQAGLIGEAPSYVTKPDIIRDIDIKPEVMAVARQGLCNVTTSTAGTAEYIFRRSRLQEIGVCGKTGTAQSPLQDEVSHAWFAAYAPRENPQIAIVAMVENSGEGSAVAAPIVCRVLQYYFFGEKKACPDYG